MILNFMQNVAVKIVLVLDDKINYGAEIGRKANITNGAVVNTLKKLEAEGIVKIQSNKKVKRKKVVVLTDKGERLKLLLEELREL